MKWKKKEKEKAKAKKKMSTKKGYEFDIKKNLGHGLAACLCT
jgi:hypothetical protein